MKDLKGLDTSFVAFARLAIALPLFIPFLRLKGLSLITGVRLVLIGAVQYGVMYCLYVLAYQYIPSYQVALFTVFTPLFVTLVNDAYLRRFEQFHFFTAIIAAIGAAVILFRFDGGYDGANVLIGFGIMQVCNLCFAFGQIEYRRLRREQPNLEDSKVFALVYLGAVIVSGLSTHYFGGWGSAAELVKSPRQMIVLLYLGAVASGLCFFWWNKVAVKSRAGVLAVFNNMKIPLGIAISLTVFGEKADLLKLIIGSVIIGAAIWLTERHSRKQV